MINAGLVGFGLAGKAFHAPSISITENINLKKIVTSRVDEVKNIYPEVEVVSQLDDVLTDDIDLVIIATPNHLHYEQCKQAIMAHKHVVVDKPFAVTLQEASELVNLAAQEGVKLSVFHNRRFDGDFLTLKELVNSGELGNINYFESNFNRFRPKVNLNKWKETTEVAGGVFYDLAPHLIDQAVNTFGPPISVLCDLETLRDQATNDDYFHLIFKYDKMRVHLNASCVTKNTRERFVIHGDRGSFSKFGMDPQEALLVAGESMNSEVMGVDSEENYGLLELDSESKRIKTIKGDYSLYYKNIAEAIENNSLLEVTAEEALFIMELIEKCLESNKEKRWIDI